MRTRGLLTGLAFFLFAMTLTAGEVKVYEEPLTLPTYRVLEPETMPNWKDRVYPYPMLDRITNEKYNKTYRAVWVENEYVKALVLPEIGGRLHGAQDKTNGYQFLYDQVTIKPGLVGLTGAWISGGVEWNFPDGHRASGFRDTDYRLVENDDGSKTVWTGEIDRVSGMRWSIGTTVHPGRNWVETKVRLFNCTPYTQRFQYWATSAVRATMEYQAVIPGELVTGHGKHEFSRWPVNDGVNITYWKNLPGATSFFAWESEADYFGGYSPEEKGGMVHVADHHIVRGKKLWTWGMAPSGRIWEDILTDGDLPYFEPQAGGYSDNQPDLHWIMPGETKIFSHYWIPVRDIGVYDYANLEGSLNLELQKNKAVFGWSPTAMNEGAQVVIMADGDEIYRNTVDTDPGNPFVGQVKVPKKTDMYALKMIVLSASGDTLLAFQPPKPTNPPLPEPFKRPPPPEEIQSQDSLYLVGDYFDRFRNPERGMRYYDEVLRRDPGDLRTNTAVGLICLMNTRFEKALEHFNKSIERDPSFYKAWYYKGIAQLKLGDIAGAEKTLNRASYGLDFYAAAHYELAQLTASQGRYERALEHIERSIRGNGDNAQAWAVKALILNRLGRYEEGLQVAEEIQKEDPMDFLSLTEKYFALKQLGRTVEAQKAYGEALKLSRLDSDNYLELAIRYIRCGQYEHALKILQILIQEDKGISPMVRYYMAWCSNAVGNSEQASRLLEEASKNPAKYCFPNRLESFPVLEWALEQNPQDGLACCLLGSLQYSRKNDEKALMYWKKAVALDPSKASAWRNIGYVLQGERKYEEAREAYEKAVKADPTNAQTVYELEQVYVDLNLPTEQKIALLEKYIDAVSQRDVSLTRLICNYVIAGRYEDALKWLREHHFKSWEGRYGIHQYWVESHIKLGDIAYEAGDYQKALEHYKLSLEYPPNLEVASQPRTIHARKNYKVAVALEALGKKGDARKFFEKVVADNPRPDNGYNYYKGKALEKLGKKAEARKVYEDFLAAVEKSLGEHNLDDEGEEGPSFFDPRRKPNALNHYKRALALEGLGRMEEAEKERKKALELDPIVALRVFSPPRAGW